MFFLGSLIVLVCLVFLWGSNPVHGVLTLVVVGLGFASLLLGEGLEFSALIVVLVYVGAVTVLFIFVVMMVNLRSTPSSYVTAESYLLWGVLAVAAATLPGTSPVGTPVGTPGEGYTNLNTLGFLLYGTERVYGVFLVGGVLFVAMVAAICLSLVSGENYRTQEFYTQIRRPNGVFNLAMFHLINGKVFQVVKGRVLTTCEAAQKEWNGMGPITQFSAGITIGTFTTGLVFLAFSNGDNSDNGTQVVNNYYTVNNYYMNTPKDSIARTLNSNSSLLNKVSTITSPRSVIEVPDVLNQKFNPEECEAAYNKLRGLQETKK